MLKLSLIGLIALLLFALGTAQSFCVCNPYDDCKKISAVPPAGDEELSGTVEAQMKSPKSENDDCCSDCFISMDASGANSGDAEAKASVSSGGLSIAFKLAAYEFLSKGKSIRAPPHIHCGPGRKTYLQKRVLLI